MLADTWATWYGRYHACQPNGTDTAKTHYPILELGKRLTVHADKIKTPLTPALIDMAFDAWESENTKRGVSLREKPDAYRKELHASIRGIESKPWFKKVTQRWIRWTGHKDFPHEGKPDEKILFAIRQHCQEEKSNEFFLSVRDAGLLVGGNAMTGSRLLNKLVEKGHLEPFDVKRRARDAQWFSITINLLNRLKPQ
jgi:hypothetical protein